MPVVIGSKISSHCPLRKSNLCTFDLGFLYWDLSGGKSGKKALPHRVGIRAGDL